MFVPAALNSNPISLGLMLAQSETNTATWAVLMVVVAGLISGFFLHQRLMANKLSKAEDKADAAEIKVADTRHSETISLIGQVGEDVKVVGGRIDKIEGRVAKVEIGHAELHERIESMKGGHGHE